LVETKRGRLSIEIDVDLPLDIIETLSRIITGVRRWKKVWYAVSQKVSMKKEFHLRLTK
jgi:hypothetical protein